MTKAQAKALRTHRQRLAHRGIVRLEVRVPRQDIGLVRRVTECLLDERTAPDLRQWLSQRFDPSGATSFKELLLWAPLDGIDLPRRSRRNRRIKL
jgi:hypothetical protein